MNDKSYNRFYDAYFLLENRKIKITLRNNDIISCCIAGFFYRNNVIYAWHIIEGKAINKAVLLNNQLLNERLIRIDEIQKLQIEQDQTIINF